MDSNLLPWVIAWVVVTTIDAILMFYRASLASHEVTGIRLSDTETDLPEIQQKSARMFSRIDLYVNCLTSLSVLMIVGIAVMWIYQRF